MLGAQGYETGGIQLTFGAGLGIEATDNADLASSDARSRISPYAGLSFGLLTTTRASSFAIDADTDVRLDAGEEGIEVAAPRLSAAYDRTSADATLALSASLQRTDLSDETVAVVDDTGLAGFVTGDATRRAATASAALTWGRTTRVTYGIAATLEDNSYSGGTATGLDGTALDDNRRLTLDGSAALSLTRAAVLRVGLGYSLYETQDPADDSATLTFSTGLTIDRPLGAVSADLAVTDLDDGQEYSLSVGRALDLPGGALSGSLGVTRTVDDRVAVTGQVAARRDLPEGSLSLDLSRQVSSLNEQDSTQLTTQVSANYTRALTRLTTMQLGFDLAQAEDVASGSESLSTGVQARLSRTLTPDWTADAGYDYIRVSDTLGDTAQSNTVFVELRRTFVTRY